MAIASIQDLQSIIAQSFFGGDIGIAGILMYAIVIMVIFLFFAKNNLILAFVLMLPLTFVFTSLSILPEPFAVLMLVISAVGIVKERTGFGTG